MDMIELLKAQNTELLKQNNSLHEELKKLTDSFNNQLAQLQSRIDQLLRILYGKKSEKQKPTELQADKPSRNTKYSATNTQPVRKKLPADLPRTEIRYELPSSELVCNLCNATCRKIGEEVYEQLDIIPAKLFVKKHIKTKYGCKNGCCIKIATMPTQPIPKGIPGPGLLAEIVINKYQDALPLYRQSLRFKRHGIDIPDTTMCDWVSQTATLLSPLVELMRTDLLTVRKIHTDDTPVPVLAKGRTKQGRLWVYVADGVNCHPCTIYDYTSNRSQTAPQKFLSGFKGYLQADAYAGYDKLYASGDIIEVGCMAHVRRKFFEIAESAKGDSLASDALNKIADIYAIEAKCRHLPYQQRYHYRRIHLRNLYRKFRRWLIRKQKTIIPNTPIAKAFNYALNHWRALQNVMADGRLEIDNNIAERAMRIVAIGRKNWMCVSRRRIHDEVLKAA